MIKDSKLFQIFYCIVKYQEETDEHFICEFDDCVNIKNFVNMLHNKKYINQNLYNKVMNKMEKNNFNYLYDYAELMKDVIKFNLDSCLIDTYLLSFYIAENFENIKLNFCKLVNNTSDEIFESFRNDEYERKRIEILFDVAIELKNKNKLLINK